MKRAIFLLVVLAVVAVVLAGGSAFILQYRKIDDMKRLTAQAEEKLDLKAYDDAIQLLRRVDAEGGIPRATYLLGKTYYTLGRVDEAMACFKRIESRHAGSGYLPDALVYMGRHALEVRSRPSEAQEIFLRILRDYPETEAADFALYHLARISYDAGDIEQARRNLMELMKRPESAARDDAEFILGEINMRELRSPEQTANAELYTIKRGDSIWKLERQFKVPGDLIVGINRLNPNALTVGQQIKIPRLDISLVVDKSRRTLTVRNQNAFLKKYRIGVNRDESVVRAGDLRVSAKFPKGIDYFDPDTNTNFKAGDPNHPLGLHYIQLRRDLGIHGTNDPAIIGTYMSRGTIALENQDIEELYGLVSVGTPVTIRGKVVVEGSLGVKP
jgi:outer membrane protein assembly factor BamD (BamD/ComL family)